MEEGRQKKGHHDPPSKTKKTCQMTCAGFWWVQLWFAPSGLRRDRLVGMNPTATVPLSS